MNAKWMVVCVALSAFPACSGEPEGMHLEANGDPMSLGEYTVIAGAVADGEDLVFARTHIEDSNPIATFDTLHADGTLSTVSFEEVGDLGRNSNGDIVACAVGERAAFLKRIGDDWSEDLVNTLGACDVDEPGVPCWWSYTDCSLLSTADGLRGAFAFNHGVDDADQTDVLLGRRGSTDLVEVGNTVQLLGLGWANRPLAVVRTPNTIEYRGESEEAGVLATNIALDAFGNQDGSRALAWTNSDRSKITVALETNDLESTDERTIAVGGEALALAVVAQEDGYVVAWATEEAFFLNAGGDTLRFDARATPTSIVGLYTTPYHVHLVYRADTNDATGILQTFALVP